MGLPNLFIASCGLGDIIKSIHYCNKVFKKEVKNYILNDSFRPEYVSEFLELVKLYLPNTEVVSKVDDLTFYNVYTLEYGSEVEKYKDISWLSTPFDYTQIRYKSKYKYKNYAVLSMDYLRDVIRVKEKHFKEYEVSCLDKGITPIIVGKEPSNSLDIKYTCRSNFSYKPEKETLDLRNKTTIEDLFYLIKNANTVYTVCNGVSVIAFELRKPCTTFGILTDNHKHVYHRRFFYNPYPEFTLLDIKDYR